MKIKDKLNTVRNGRKYELVAAADPGMVTVRIPQKGWESIPSHPKPAYVPPKEYKKSYISDRAYNNFRACDLFLVAKWPSFREVFPNGATRKIKSK